MASLARKQRGKKICYVCLCIAPRIGSKLQKETVVLFLHVRVHKLPRIYISRLSSNRLCTFTFVQNSFQAVGDQWLEMAWSLVIIRLSEILRKMSIPDLSCCPTSPVDHNSFHTQSHRRHLLYLLYFRKEQMNASQERREDASSQNEQQEKTLTPKKYHFYIFPG